MEENYKLEKEYTIPIDVFREAYTSFQKQFICPKHNLFMGIFCVIAVVFIGIAVNNTSNYLPYVGALACLAFAAREWYNPKKMRRSICDSVRELGEPVYKIGVADGFFDISTVSDDKVKPENDEDDIEPLPEKTRIQRSDEYQLLEYDKYFLILPDSESLYVLPKKNFTDAELELIRN